MSDPQKYPAWIAEFEKAGYDVIRDGVFGNSFKYPEPKRQLAIEWLSQQAAKRSERETQLHFYARWTFRAAVAAVIVGILGVAATLLH